MPPDTPPATGLHLARQTGWLGLRMTLLLCLGLGCAPAEAPRQQTDPPHPGSRSGFQQVQGRLEKVLQQGKDGQVWQLRAADGSSHQLLISVANLKTQPQLALQLQAGDQIHVSGELLKLGTTSQVIAREVRRLNQP